MKDGTLKAVDFKVYTNTGAYASSALNVSGAMSHKVFKAYKIDHMRFQCQPVYIQKTGRVRGEDDVIAYHLRQSFVPGKITPEEANRLGCELAKRFTKGNHAYIVCTHIDKSHIHNHVIWNSTALNQTRKFRNFWGSSRAVRRLNDTICIENGYSIVENPKRHGKSYR